MKNSNPIKYFILKNYKYILKSLSPLIFKLIRKKLSIKNLS